MTDQLIVERGGLEKKDKSELQAIVQALGGTATTRARKADLIDQILELSGAALPAEGASPDPTSDEAATTESSDKTADGSDEPAVSADKTDDETADKTDDSSDKAPDNTAETAAGSGKPAGGSDSTAADSTSPDSTSPDSNGAGDASAGDASGEGSNDKASADVGGSSGRDSRQKGGSNRGTGGGRSERGSGRQSSRGRGGAKASQRNDEGHPVGPDGEPLADWEVEVMADGDGQPKSGQKSGGRNNDRKKNDQKRNESQSKSNDPSDSNKDRGEKDRNDKDRGDKEDVDPNNRRGRRRGRNRGRDRDDIGNDPISAEPVAVEGSLDLRDEGYGFLRVAGYLPSKEDVYVSVKQVRQYGLRKGDHLTGLSRPANRNEKNPGFHQINTVNGKAPEEAKNRPRFDDLTPLFPDERLVMAMREEPLNMTTRIIDLVAPIGKGQRGMIVSPPKAGKTTVIKDIARAVETNNPEVKLIVLLVDERPEEVTDMRRSLTAGEVAASTFDRPPEEHCAVAELTIERAKRMVETGQDVCIILDGITRLARAYNLTAPQTGRAMSGGLDAAALYPPKRILGAARNLEEGGSLTILATALVETGSKMDDVIFEEFKGTGNMELRLDRRLAEKRIFPAIDIDASSTRNEELLFDRTQLKQAWKLRKVLSGMSEEGSSAGAIEMLIDRLQTFKSNDDFLAEIGKAPSV